MKLNHISQLAFEKKLPFDHQALQSSTPDYIVYNLDNGFELVICTNGGLDEEWQCWISLAYTGMGTMILDHEESDSATNGVPESWRTVTGEIYVRIADVFVGPFNELSRDAVMAHQDDNKVIWDLELVDGTDPHTSFYILEPISNMLVQRAPFFSLASKETCEDAITGMVLVTGCNDEEDKNNRACHMKSHFDLVEGVQDMEGERIGEQE